MRYIYIKGATKTSRPLSTRCAQKTYWSLQKSPKSNMRKNQSIPKQVKGLDHQQCILEARARLVVLNHRYENSFTLSNSWCTEFSEFWKTLRFLSFQTTQTHASQTSCRKDRRALGPPAEWVNWTKWSERLCTSAVEKPIQARMSGQSEPNNF
jgi:hypothetical protein